jgi:hypothetical protein
MRIIYIYIHIHCRVYIYICIMLWVKQIHNYVYIYIHMCIGTCVYICIFIQLSNPIYAYDIYIYLEPQETKDMLVMNDNELLRNS